MRPFKISTVGGVIGTVFLVAFLLASFESAEGRAMMRPKYDGMYSGHKVVRFVPETDQQAKAFSAMFQLAPQLEVDFWTELSQAAGQPVDIRASPDQADRLLEIADRLNVKYAILDNDLQETLEAEDAAPSGSLFSWTAYHALSDIYEWMNAQARAHSFVEVSNIGLSFEGRPVRVMHIDKKPDSGADIPKIGIYVQSGIHAREWITMATVTWMFNEMLNNEMYAGHLERYDIYYVPVVNPDGYEYSRSTDRLWRKTRSLYPGAHNPKNCSGVDANRNWDVNFGVMLEANSKDPCHKYYHGPMAHSEPEIKAITDFLLLLQLKARNKIRFFVDFHSYGQLILLPWGFTNELPLDYPDLHHAANKYKLAAEKVNGMTYMLGTGPSLLYSASGFSKDWAKRVAGIKYSQTVELRPSVSVNLPGGDRLLGQILPARQIIPCGNETLFGFLAEAQTIWYNVVMGLE